MQSLAHNDRSHYMWDGIVCLADKPVESESVRAKPARLCICLQACVVTLAGPRVFLHAGENASVRAISLSPLCPPPTCRKPKTEPSCIVLCASLGGLDVAKRGESLQVETWPCIAKQKKLDASAREPWLRRNLLKYPLKVTAHANVLNPFSCSSFACAHDCVCAQDKKRTNKRKESSQFLDFLASFDITYLAHLSLNRCILCGLGLMHLRGNSESAAPFSLKDHDKC